ncbi:MAG: Undecaprenyl-phosphate 4-deoxy-4-formamido-L-arabinose transferase [Planctomycetota bacterium]
MSVSVVVPVRDEKDNVLPLWSRLHETLSGTGWPYELIFVDDGSRDGTTEVLRELAAEDSHVKVLVFRRNFGQTAAMHAGIQAAVHDVVVTMDGDLQNDPSDIPMMIDKLEEGYDLVHGWRQRRQDTFVNRRLPSMIANWLISRTTRFPIRDLGCSLKAIRREIAQELELYGEMHRFIPILAHQRGARCVEVAVQHHARKFGVTKYGISRTIRVILDLLTVKYLLEYSASPMKLFGRIGLLCFAVAMSTGVATLLMKLLGQVDMTGNPLLLLTVLAGMVSMQFFSLGLLGEVCARIYFTSQPKQNYAIRERIEYPMTTRRQRAA